MPVCLPPNFAPYAMPVYANVIEQPLLDASSPLAQFFPLLVQQPFAGAAAPPPSQPPTYAMQHHHHQQQPSEPVSRRQNNRGPKRGNWRGPGRRGGNNSNH
jgi:hypothetical protein